VPLGRRKNSPLFFLALGHIFVYNLDKQTVVVQGLMAPTAPAIFRNLNPSVSLNLDARSIKSKAENMATYIN
jgi:hypothetical protein